MFSFDRVNGFESKIVLAIVLNVDNSTGPNNNNNNNIKNNKRNTKFEKMILNKQNQLKKIRELKIYTQCLKTTLRFTVKGKIEEEGGTYRIRLFT